VTGLDAPLPPNATVGILGGGQLGRMLCLAAARLGLKCHILAPEKDSPAFQVSAAHTIAAYDDKVALADFAAAVDCVTYEFENVPVEAVEFLEKLKPVRPGSKALRVAQDRLLEKQLARDLSAMTADFAAVNSHEELLRRIDEIGVPAVLKTCRFGYDGKGQAKIMTRSDAAASWEAMRGQPSILESFVDFHMEVSVIAARDAAGGFVAYDVTENVHRHHILHTATVPSRLDPEAQREALDIAKRIADALDYVGVLGVEFFALQHRGRSHVYVNEIAPRVHNSGHWTMDACLVSQFEQHIRAVAGWPLAIPYRHSDCVMTNLIGEEILAAPQLAAEPQTAVHIYGKAEWRQGRKMGHFNRLTSRQA
jgi:5-(carboxyamino)imidazole ribonucleotide synthase